MVHPVLSALRDSRQISDRDLRSLLRLGRGFKAGALPSGIGMREPGECFAVARELAHAGWGVYVRGFALRPDSTEPLAHAWVSEGDTALDASWTEATSCSYWGISGMAYEDELKRMSKPFLRRGLANGFALSS